MRLDLLIVLFILMAKCAGCAKLISDGQINNHRARCKKAKVLLGDSLRINQQIRKKKTDARYLLKRRPQSGSPPVHLVEDHLPINALIEVCTLLHWFYSADMFLLSRKILTRSLI